MICRLLVIAAQYLEADFVERSSWIFLAVYTVFFAQRARARVHKLSRLRREYRRRPHPQGASHTDVDHARVRLRLVRLLASDDRLPAHDSERICAPQPRRGVSEHGFRLFLYRLLTFASSV